MLPDPGLEQRDLLRLGKLRGRNPHAGRHARLLHQAPPLFSVRSHAVAVHIVNGGMGGLVAKDLSQEADGAVDEPGGQCDLAASRSVAPKRASESRAEAEPDLVTQLRNAPDPRPLDDWRPQFPYPLARFRLHGSTHSMSRTSRPQPKRESK